MSTASIGFSSAFKVVSWLCSRENTLKYIDVSFVSVSTILFPSLRINIRCHNHFMSDIVSSHLLAKFILTILKYDIQMVVKVIIVTDLTLLAEGFPFRPG